MNTVWNWIQPRPQNAHKGKFGFLTIVAGSSRYRGAASLAVRGALRSGAGIVCLASVESVIASVASSVPECTFLPLPLQQETGTISENAASLVLSEIPSATAMLIGCGLGANDNIAALTGNLIKNAACQLVLDADALNVLRDNKFLLRQLKTPAILTPHPGEMARLTGKSVAEICADPIASAKAFSEAYRCVVVLKGHRTVIVSPDGRTEVNQTGNAGLARGGSGDVLAGIISSFAAQGIPPYEAAVSGVYLHGLAADRCAVRLSQTGMLPSDILTDLCSIFLENGR